MTTMEAFATSFRDQRVRTRTRKPVVAIALGKVLGTLLYIVAPFVLPVLSIALFAVGGFLLAPAVGFFILGLGVLGLWVLVERSYGG